MLQSPLRVMYVPSIFIYLVFFKDLDRYEENPTVYIDNEHKWFTSGAAQDERANEKQKFSTCTLNVATLLVPVDAYDETFLLDMIGGAMRSAPLIATNLEC